MSYIINTSFTLYVNCSLLIRIFLSFDYSNISGNVTDTKHTDLVLYEVKRSKFLEH